METTELIRRLEHSFWSIVEANPDWDGSLVQYLRDNGIKDDDIYAAVPDLAIAAGIDEPEWY